MSPERLRVGIIGASVNAMWGPRAHVPAVQALPEFELAAVCTAHPETAAESAAKFGARLAFSDHRELVNHPDVDVVTVSLRVPSHYRTTMDALEAGKHVYTEWPSAHPSRRPRRWRPWRAPRASVSWLASSRGDLRPICT